jgi:hypothetical protein
MGFKTQSVFTATYTNTTFTITESMGVSSVTVTLMSGAATILGGLTIPGLTNSSVPLSFGQSIVLRANKGYSLTGISIDSTAGGVFEIYIVYDYNNAINPSAQAFITATGITGSTQIAAINTLVNGLQADGLWSKMKAVYPFVTDNRNLLGYTEDFSNGVWANSNLTITTNSIIAPNGTLTADKIENNATVGNHFVRQTITSTSLQVYTLSVYLKEGTKNVITIADGFNTNELGTYNLSTQTATNRAGTNASITSVGNGWYRCSITYTPTSTSLGFMLFSGNTYAGTDTSGNFYSWGAQLELGSTATTYQPIATTQQAYIASQFKYNLVNPVDSDAAFRLVFNGGWTHSSNGALPNGTNGYADTKLVPSSVLAQNSASIGFYSRTNNIGNVIDMGSTNLSFNDALYFFYNVGGNLDYSRNNNSNALSGSTSSSIGFIINKRTTSTDMVVLRNNLNPIFNTNATTGRSASPIYISALNTAGSASLFSNRQTAFNFIADGLTDTEAANLYTRVQAFQTALSRQV